MQILLHPVGTNEDQSLASIYDKAISEAAELHIVTAYLTDWSPKSVPSIDCQELTFVVGTDFGITTKDACRAVLKWLPNTMKNDFLAADNISGFHPKLVLWKTKSGECNVVLGSSNLTQAAFSANQARQDFSRKLKWGPSDFSSEKLLGDYCLRRPRFALRPCHYATSSSTRCGSVALPQMALRRVAMPCILPPPALFAQTPAKHPALRLSGTKNLHFAIAPFPRFSAYEANACFPVSIEKY